MLSNVQLELYLVSQACLLLLLLIGGLVEHVLAADQGDDGQDLLSTAELGSSQDGGRQLRVEREAGHLPAEIRQFVVVTHSSQQFELPHGAVDVLGARGVHEVKCLDVLDANIEHRQDHARQVASLYFRNGGLLQLLELTKIKESCLLLILISYGLS